MGALLGLLTGVGPLLVALVNAHSAAVASKDNEAVEIIRGQVEALKAAYGLAATAAGQIIVAAFAALVWVYMAKIIVWDNVLGYYTHGTTPAVRGDVAVWMGLIITFVFGHGIVTRIMR
jgi:hypothetical protein